MNTKTLKALKGSIRKWERIVAGHGTDEGVDNCPLCKLFYGSDDTDEPYCDGCPIRTITGRAFCLGSPYERWADMFHFGMTRSVVDKDTLVAAQAELDFLKSLLPKKP